MLNRIATWAGLIVLLAQVGCSSSNRIGNFSGQPIPAALTLFMEAPPDVVRGIIDQAYPALSADEQEAGALAYRGVLQGQDVTLRLIPNQAGTRLDIVSVYPEDARVPYVFVPARIKNTLGDEVDGTRYSKVYTQSEYREGPSWCWGPLNAIESRPENGGYEALPEGGKLPVLIGGMQDFQRGITYPELARRAGIEGRVFVTMVVTEDGTPTCIHILNPLPGGLSEESMDVVRSARFHPGTIDGHPVKVRMSLPITYRLN